MCVVAAPVASACRGTARQRAAMLTPTCAAAPPRPRRPPSARDVQHDRVQPRADRCGVQRVRARPWGDGTVNPARLTPPPRLLRFSVTPTTAVARLCCASRPAASAGSPMAARSARRWTERHHPPTRPTCMQRALVSRGACRGASNDPINLSKEVAMSRGRWGTCTGLVGGTGGAGGVASVAQLELPLCTWRLLRRRWKVKRPLCRSEARRARRTAERATTKTKFRSPVHRWETRSRCSTLSVCRHNIALVRSKFPCFTDHIARRPRGVDIAREGGAARAVVAAAVRAERGEARWARAWRYRFLRTAPTQGRCVCRGSCQGGGHRSGQVLAASD